MSFLVLEFFFFKMSKKADLNIKVQKYKKSIPGPDPSGKDGACVNDEAESVAETVCGSAQVLGHNVVLGRPVVGGVTHIHALVEVQVHHPNNTLQKRYLRLA